MRTSDFDYHLPPELIAQTPADPRDASRLLVIDRSTGNLVHRQFRDIAGYLRPGDLLVCNDSRVIPARVFGHKVPTGGKAELLLLAKRGDSVWEALTRGKHIRAGTRIRLDGPDAGGDPDTDDNAQDVPVGTVLEVTPAGSRLIEFEGPVDAWLERHGIVPLPPYIHQPLSDPERYQTVYARIQGSVAAPTAGLHFTPGLIERIQALGARFTFVTLHIGLDTFRPVQEERVEEHQIHTEFAVLGPEAAREINATRREGSRIIAVGTTAVRVLESAARRSRELGSPDLVSSMADRTDLFIYPGYEFRAVDAMITNFHLPRSTLLMLVSAFAGRELILEAYREAVRERYRFYSLGDATLIL